MRDITYGDVRESIAVARSHGEKFFEQIAWQIENKTWTVLGYKSWDEMREVEYKDMRGLMAPATERPELVARMRQSGLTQQSIADTLGVTDRTVRSDLNRKDFRSDSPIDTQRGGRPAHYLQPVPQPTAERIDPTTGEVLDRKTYPRPEPQQQPAQKRRPLPDAFGEGVYQIRLKAESLERLTRDDRFAANKEKTAQSELRRLINTRDLINQVIDQLS